MVPFYRGLSGQPSALYKAMTLEAKPVEAPTQLAWFQVNVSTVDILWKPIPSPSFRGKPLGYQVRHILMFGKTKTHLYFRSFPTNNTIFTTNQCEKMSKCPSSIRRRDSNPRPYEHELSPITTRPGLPPSQALLFNILHWCHFNSFRSP